VVLSDLTWPGGARFAVSLTFDVDAEAGWLGEGGEQYARRLTTLSEGRFGVVRGLPRIAEALARHGLAATFFVPGYTAELHSEAIVALVDAGHEIGHHGYLHLRSDKVDADAQRAEIERGFAALEAAGLPRPVGYRSAAWELTPETFDLLIEQDFAYDSSCMCDDRPYWEEWHGRRILELPVHWSLDDWPRFGWTIDRGGNMSDPHGRPPRPHDAPGGDRPGLEVHGVQCLAGRLGAGRRRVAGPAGRGGRPCAARSVIPRAVSGPTYPWSEWMPRSSNII
jgi:hypothetical protein